jgi:hypothetical protein
MPQHGIERWSPQYVIHHGNRLLDLGADTLAGRLERSSTGRALARGGLVVLGLAVIALSVRATVEGVVLGPFALTPALAGALAIALGLLGPARPQRFSPSFPTFLLLLLLLGWLHHLLSPLPIILGTVLYQLVIFAVPFLLLRWTVRFRAWSVVVLVGFLMAALPLLLRVIDFDDFAPTMMLAIDQLANPWRVLVLAVVLVSYAQVSPGQFTPMLRHWWEPALLFHIMPFFAVHDSERPWRELVLGAKNLLVGFSVIQAAVILRYHLPADGIPVESTAGFLTRGLLSYVFYFLISWGAAQVFSSFFQLTGRRMGDLFDWPLLAASPMIKWRTWNIPYFEWTRLFVFMPLMRRTGMLGLSVVVSFLVAFVFHVDHFVFSNILPQYPPPPDLPKFMVGMLLFFILQGVAVWLAIRTGRYWPTAGSRKGWLGVALTWAMMIAIHSFRIY